MSSLMLFTLIALLHSPCFGVVSSGGPQCFTFMSHHSSCPESWHHWGDSCYRITDSNVLWSNARDECGKLDGVLAAPSSSQENEFIVSLIPAGGYVWIDCNDIEEEGRWECREGGIQVSYRNWYSTEPNNVGEEDCAIISRAVGIAEWHDVGCNWVCRVACKLVGRPVLRIEQ
ncbi:perlucin-like protein [Asterias rubens]|uniref:perlucin-like protein n=1 Tax=Asterias rubens TaxID=7604 RepID=UPI001455B0D9|nr:perlucin-like protein [Asterias rubens]